MLAQAFKMFSRNSQPASSSNAPAARAFQRDIEDLLAENLVSACRTARILDKASKAGIRGIKRTLRKTFGRNHARDAQRSKLKWSKWPDYYFFRCRIFNRKTQEEETVEIPINLPSEILEVLWELGSAEALLSEANLDSAGKDHMKWMREQLGVESLLGWGLHGDGIPCNYDRTESVVMISLNLPGLSGRNGRMRIPLVILPDYAVSENTFDDIMEVLAWSMRHMLDGIRPSCRHDGQPFNKSDDKRAKRAKKSGNLPFRACLNQVRADWDWMGKCFHFPFHNVGEGCCWLCKCKRNEVRETNNSWKRKVCSYMRYTSLIIIHGSSRFAVMRHTSSMTIVNAPMQYATAM